MTKILPATIQAVIERLALLPGMGPKSASRLTFYLLNRPQYELDELGQALIALKQQLKRCASCFNYTQDETSCELCLDETRRIDQLLVVEQPLQLVNLESAGYRGRYHVLGGAISPLQGIGPDELTIIPLLDRLASSPTVTELILATNPTLEGEATALYIHREILKRPQLTLKVTRIARGLPIGGDLEYADSQTIERALAGRQSLE